MAAMPEFSTDRFAGKLGLFYAAYFLFGGIQLPFFPLWLEARGLDSRTIGMVIAVPMLVRIVATPIITRQADRHQALKSALVLASIAATLAMTVLGLVQGAAAILVTFVVAAVAFSPVLSLTDAYAVSGLTARGRAYGPVRLWGSVAFIAASVAGGLIFDLIAPANLIWLIFAGNCAIAATALRLVPLARDEPIAPRPATGHSHLRQPAFLAIAAAASLIQASHAVYYGFATLDWSARGFDGPLIGVLWGLGIIGEIVLFAFAARIPAAVGPVALIMIGAGGAVLRWTLASLNPPIAVMVLLQLLHGASFGATHLGTMMYLSRNAPEGARAAAQGDIATANSLMMAAASALAGLLYGLSGSLAYAAMAAMGGAGAAFALLAAFLRRG